ncbi:MAG TPA: helix-turn-helix domain-containing protein [Gammaproteobacteria bacterium]|jgi:SOS-response transcriptional repressor LexA|nr:helix-turn-helix domain-containing protein [Gammaproteobacteria bacterium]
MFDKLSDNLNLLMAKTRINASELARQTGVPASTIKKIRSRNNINPTLATLLPLAKKFDINVSQLIGDSEIPERETKRTLNHETKESYLPLLTWREASVWPNLPNNKQSLSDISSRKYSKQCFTLTIDEDNWEGFSKESVIIIDPEAAIEHRDFVLVHKEGSSTPALRQVLHDDGNIYLKPIVTDYNVTLLTPQHRFVGVVIETRKKLKR